jgi:hypothetical protein
MAVKGEWEVEGIPGLWGEIEATVYEVGEAPSRILDIHDPWNIDVKWKLSGPTARFICGTFAVDAYMESIGRGPEFELPDDAKELAEISLQPNPTNEYSATFKVPADYIRTAVENDPGHRPERESDIVYKLVVTVTYKDPCGRPGPIAGFVEYPMLQFYYDLD